MQKTCPSVCRIKEQLAEYVLGKIQELADALRKHQGGTVEASPPSVYQSASSYSPVESMANLLTLAYAAQGTGHYCRAWQCDALKRWLLLAKNAAPGTAG